MTEIFGSTSLSRVGQYLDVQSKYRTKITLEFNFHHCTPPHSTDTALHSTAPHRSSPHCTTQTALHRIAAPHCTDTAPHRTAQTQHRSAQLFTVLHRTAPHHTALHTTPPHRSNTRKKKRALDVTHSLPFKVSLSATEDFRWVFFFSCISHVDVLKNTFSGIDISYCLDWLFLSLSPFLSGLLPIILDTFLLKKLLNGLHFTYHGFLILLQAYADALLVIPKILAQNSGYDPQETIVKLQVIKSKMNLASYLKIYP